MKGFGESETVEGHIAFLPPQPQYTQDACPPLGARRHLFHVYVQAHKLLLSPTKELTSQAGRAKDRVLISISVFRLAVNTSCDLFPTIHKRHFSGENLQKKKKLLLSKI